MKPWNTILKSICYSFVKFNSLISETAKKGQVYRKDRQLPNAVKGMWPACPSGTSTLGLYKVLTKLCGVCAHLRAASLETTMVWCCS